MGSHKTKEVAKRMFDFALLSVRGVDTSEPMYFGKAGYLGANGMLKSVEAALPELTSREREDVLKKLARVGAGAGEGEGERGGERRG
ncbi:hypothetical protein FOA52_012643 [Chlamydomonas sp. UWO 241]|nr:hypothetical protein FOA52_012643 [Chlamydomonas sp. UWO 241]